jgi:hypothetical protein
MECYRRAMIPQQSFEGRRENLNQANKLSRTYATLLESLNRHRGKGQQKVTVEHVHVHAGRQAVVGMVETPGGAKRKNRGSTPCKASCLCTAAPAAGRGRERGALASRRQWRTDDAECTGGSRPEHRRVIRTRSKMGGGHLDHPIAVAQLVLCCG